MHSKSGTEQRIQSSATWSKPLQQNTQQMLTLKIQPQVTITRQNQRPHSTSFHWTTLNIFFWKIAELKDYFWAPQMEKKFAFGFNKWVTKKEPLAPD